MSDWAVAAGDGHPPDDARAAPASLKSGAQWIDFDLPAQPLASALNRYAAISGQSVMFVDALVAGRMSSVLRGRYTPQAALAALLAGTGLMADDVSEQRQGALVLKLAAAAAVPTVAPGGETDRGYDGLVQARVWEALCADARTAPGGYRSILRFQVAPSGHIHQASMISSSGEGGRDAAMLAILAQLRMDRSPPPDLVQPLTLVILPHDVLPGPRCRPTVH